MSSFSASLIAWQRCHGRHGLPWQGADAYCVWLSEIMLQQTQVATVIPYYQRFIASFPDIAALAAATEEAVLEHWSGLGYYARGRNLHRAAKQIADIHGGIFPDRFEQILELPGIGRSTAAAICAQAFHQPYAILDGNVKRVLTRYCGISGSPSVKSVEVQLWSRAESLLPESDVATYTQALMDMGATCCTRSKPRCERCPVQPGCVAYQTGRVAELPTPRQRRAVPERHATFVIAMNWGDILLEKRNTAGIWGGLWCLPQLEEGDEDLAEYAQCRGWQIDEQASLPVFIHTFTHFKLHITPLLLNLAHKPPHRAESVWMGRGMALSAAIPAPVRRLLEGLGPFSDRQGFALP
jgi:A/G-specific adenine glycosylase